MPRIPRPVVLVSLVSAVAACGGAAERAPNGADDFAALQERGRQAMGVDQYTSTHVFEPLPDGGRIVLRRDSLDPSGTAVIRAHLDEIAGRFRDGDFAVPGFVHAGEVPGTAEMRARRDRIRYLTDTVARGGEVRILTTDPAAVEAVHAFLAFQRREHHAGSHDEEQSTPGPR